MVVQSESGSVNSDDITDSLDDWQIFESLGIENQGSVITCITGALLTLNIETWVNNLKRADVSVLVSLVWECSINNSSIEVLGLSRC